MKFSSVNALTLILILGLTSSVSAQDNLVVFSGRKAPLIKPVIELFEKTYDIKVTVKTGKSAALGQQILQEQPNPSADIFIAKESGSLEFLRKQDAFTPYQSELTNKIPANLKARDGSWVGVSGRSRAVIYNKDLIAREDVPKSLNDLVNPKYKGKIAAVNNANESLIAWIVGLRLKLGDESVTTILNQLKENDIQLLSKSHTDIRKAVGRGEYPLGLINHYYYHLQKRETDKELTNVGIVYLDQEPNGRGELVNVSGAAIVKGANNLASAKLFIDFLVSSEAQKMFAEVNFEYPLIDNVNTHLEVVEAMGCSEKQALSCLKVMDVNLDQFADKWETTLDMLDQINWF